MKKKTTKLRRFWQMIVMMILAASATGCATEAGFRQMMDSWVGASESQLVGQLGPPARTWGSREGDYYMTWQHRETSVVPGYATTNCYGWTCSTLYFPAEQVQHACDMNFRLRGGRVDYWTAKGNACKARAK